MKNIDISLGEKISMRAFHLAMRNETNIDNKKIVIDILYFFKDNPDDMDLKTICRLESLLGEDLLIIPTKQQWRKIKLEQIILRST